VRELDERLGLSELIAEHLTDSRGKNTQLPMADLLRQAVYSRLAGYEDVNDAQRLSQDPTFRLMGSERIWERGAALTSRLQSFETELLTQAENLSGLAAINRELIARAETIESPQRVVLDMDSTEIPATGSRNRAPTTNTTNRPAITRCCCSTARATVLRRNCGRVTCIVRKTGQNCYYRRSSTSKNSARKWCFAPMLPLPSRRFTMLWRREV